MNTYFEEMINQGNTPKYKIQQTATTTATIVFEKHGRIDAEILAIKVTNFSSSINLLVSFDGGTNFVAILPLGTINIPTQGCHELQIRSASSTAVYDLSYAVRP